MGKKHGSNRRNQKTENCVLLLPAKEFAFANWDDQGINPVVAEGSSEHRLQCGLVVYGIIGNQDASRHHAGHQSLVTTAVDFLFGIEEAEGDIVAARKVSQGVGVDQFDDIVNSCGSEGQASQLRFVLQDFVGREFSAHGPASQG